MPETHSKIAIALTETAIHRVISSDKKALREVLARAFDERLSQVREAYKPEELARCPIVTHHPLGPCAYCNTAAMREFILLPEDLNA